MLKSILATLRKVFSRPSKVETMTGDFQLGVATGEGIDSYPLERIEDEERREEFIQTYQRLSDRCGRNAMDATFILYLIEKHIRKGEIPTPGQDGTPKITNVGFKNTAQIIVRFVENRWMDFYLASEDFLSSIPSMMQFGKSVFLGQADGGQKDPKHVAALLENPSEDLLEFVRNSHEELREKSEYVSPEEIQKRFNEIDKKYEDGERIN